MTENGAKKRHRSPEHPYIDLATAIERARVFYQNEHYNFASTTSALEHWGYGPKSSSGMRNVAALLHFGLLKEKGSGSERRVALSDVGRILAHPDSSAEARRGAMKEAALSPQVYAKLWEAWGGGGRLPSEREMRFQLETRHGFNPKAIDGFIADFVSTLTLANVLKNDTLSEGASDAHSGDPADDALPGIRPPGTQRPQEEGRMPDTQGATGTRPFDLPILLQAGQATLRIPIPLTTDDYDLLRKALDANLTLYRPSLVRPAEPKPDDDEPA